MKTLDMLQLAPSKVDTVNTESSVHILTLNHAEYKTSDVTLANPRFHIHVPVKKASDGLSATPPLHVQVLIPNFSFLGLGFYRRQHQLRIISSTLFQHIVQASGFHTAVDTAETQLPFQA